jgi:hypothetical protein
VDRKKRVTGDRASNPSGRGVGWHREREQDHRIAVSHDDFSRDVLASSPDTCPGQISWDYDRAEIIADGVVHAIGVCLGLIGVTIVVIAVNIERIEIAPILTYVIGLVTMLALSAAYNICLARQVGSADYCEPVMVPPPRVPTRCEELSAFTDEFAKVRLRDGHGENPCRCPDDFDW